ncbi:MAG: YtxH domain-containing protein [Candidatus Roizmanbacteria bacterium]
MNTHHQSSSHTFFWFGALLGGAAMYFVATKKGRSLLKDALDVAENLDEYIAEAVTHVSKEIQDVSDGSTTMGEVMSKIQSVIPQKKTPSKSKK